MHQLPHEKLVAYAVAVELLTAVREAAITDPKLRDQALRAAKSACLNIAEAAGRQGAQDQRRVFGIARGEACEAAAAVHIAEGAGECRNGSATRASALANRLYGLLVGLIRASARSRSQTQSETRTQSQSQAQSQSQSQMGSETPPDDDLPNP